MDSAELRELRELSELSVPLRKDVKGYYCPVARNLVQTRYEIRLVVLVEAPIVRMLTRLPLIMRFALGGRDAARTDETQTSYGEQSVGAGRGRRRVSGRVRRLSPTCVYVKAGVTYKSYGLLNVSAS